MNWKILMQLWIPAEYLEDFPNFDSFLNNLNVTACPGLIKWSVIFPCLTSNLSLNLVHKKSLEEPEFAKLQEPNVVTVAYATLEPLISFCKGPKTQGLRLNTKHILN